jgi:hypothetical protein
MPSLTLPKRSPTSLRAFWLVASTGIGLTVAGAGAVMRRDARLLLAAVPVAAVTAVPGLRNPWSVDLPYRAWDRLGREVGSGCTDLVSRVAYEALRLTSHLGEEPEMPKRPPGRSGWTERHTQPTSRYFLQDAFGDLVEGADAFDRYARQPGHGWAESLRPLVRLLAQLETAEDADESPPTDIYTLY